MGGEWEEQGSYIHVEWKNGSQVPAINGTKCALTLHTCISVTDRVNINKQNK